MSKYTEAIIDKVDLIQRCERSLEYYLNNSSLFPIIKKELDEARLDLEALEIADRLEQADVDVYNKCCEVCTSLTICKERGEMCDEASAWEDGYNQALADIRGDNNGN